MWLSNGILPRGGKQEVGECLNGYKKPPGNQCRIVLQAQDAAGKATGSAKDAAGSVQVGIQRLS